MHKVKVQDKSFQPRGMETGRTLRHALLASFIPMGNSAAKFDRKNLFKMWLTHRFGGVVFPFLVRNEHRLNTLYLRLRRIRN
jgi:hypothetical protein